MRQALRRFGLFWVDFVLGDDWTLAVVVVVALLVTWGLSHTGFPAWVAPVVIDHRGRAPAAPTAG
jgi:uncharacterized membrane protein